jgi:hypothetical protein
VILKLTEIHTHTHTHSERKQQSEEEKWGGEAGGMDLLPLSTPVGRGSCRTQGT